MLENVTFSVLTYTNSLSVENWRSVLLTCICIYSSVPQIHPPPFATLALVQIAGGGGAYTRDATFSLLITPSLNREMFSGSVDAGFILVLPFYHGDLA